MNVVNSSQKTIQERAIQMMQDTWQSIGPDVLQAASSEEGVLALTWDEIMDVCSTSFGLYGRDPEAYEWYKELTFEQKRKLWRKAFPLEGYGA